MRQAPRIRGGLAIRAVVLFAGLTLFAAAIVSLLESGLGLAPWDVFHLGIAAHSALTIGTAGIVVGLVVLTGAWALGHPPGFGTLANAIVIGALVDVFRANDAVARLSQGSLPTRLVLLILGIGLFGVASALYIGAGLGAGPRDSLMLVLSRRTGVRIAVVRGAIEVTVVVTGALLGGTFGVGTIAVALLVGPAVEAGFWGLERTGLAVAVPIGNGVVQPSPLGGPDAVG
jgi:uncharacterized membrane protein YczE